MPKGYKTEINSGDKYYRWTIVKEVERDKWKRRMVFCQCNCGTKRIIHLAGLLTGQSKSCGCKRREHLLSMTKKHGYSREKLYKVHTSMLQRCLNKKNSVYKYYGGRGIKIYDEWLEYENFRKWAIDNGYKEGLTIERKNVNGNYEPNNCEWITQSKQSNNTRRNRMIEYNGKNQSLKDWSDELGINYATLNGRLRRGWTVEKAFNESVDINRSNRRKNDGF